MKNQCATDQFGFPLCARLIGGVPLSAKYTLTCLSTLEATLDEAPAGCLPAGVQGQLERLRSALESLITEAARANVEGV